MREDTIARLVMGVTILATAAALYVWVTSVEASNARAAAGSPALLTVAPPPSPQFSSPASQPASSPSATPTAAAPAKPVSSIAAQPLPTAVLETATPSPRPASLNDVPLAEIVVMPPTVVANMRFVFAHGQALGRSAQAFSKIGDSTIENLHFLSGFDEEPHDLGAYGFLRPLINHFGGSFARDSIAVRLGFHSWSAFDPFWADGEHCEPDEGPVPCEVRLHNPSIVLIRLGVNDTSVPVSFDRNMRELVAYCLEQGIIPVLGTKADRLEGPQNTNNEILRQIAAEFAVPLWDFDRVAGTLPGRGLGPDGVHMTSTYNFDFADPQALTAGHAVHNLTALLMLDALWRDVMQGHE